MYVAGASIAANLLDVHSLLSSGDAVLVDLGDTARIARAIEATNKALLHKLARERTPLATR